MERLDEDLTETLNLIDLVLCEAHPDFDSEVVF